MDVPISPWISKSAVKVILPIANDWLVGWSVNLTKFAKIAITESIWLILGVDIPISLQI